MRAITMIGVLVIAQTAVADDVGPHQEIEGQIEGLDDVQEPEDAEAEESITVEIPSECKVYAPKEGDPEPVLWNQTLSFAGCIQDSSLVQVDDPKQLEEMVATYARALAPSIMLYFGTIEYGPDAAQLRAAYQLGMMHVALVVRARNSLPATDRALHRDLEPLLAPAVQTAQLAFALIDEAERENPAIAPDPVTKGMVRSAREMLKTIGDVPEEGAIRSAAAPADEEKVQPE
jgi:hypothetical protein